jgi:c-di-GMP-binding flagellar brake protein YcgR
MSTEDKRKHRRAPLAAHVRLFLDEGELVLRGTIADISLGGIGLHLVHPLKVGAEVTLEISFPVIGVGIQKGTIRGKIIYCEHIEGTYYVGIQFNQELNPIQQLELYSRIQDILESF